MKRLIDIVLAGGALLLLSPVIAVVAVYVAMRIGRPILFIQSRAGRYGQPFKMYKFRTMTDERDADGNLLPDDQRLPAAGAFLRSTSLDELPELWNILKGDMSVVGPRPLLLRYLDRYTPEQARRHEVRPGLTGYAQVNGRNAIAWEEKFAFDVWYVDHRSLLLDLKIIVLTLLRVFQASGVRGGDHATMAEFMGSDADGLSPDQAATRRPT